MTHDEISNCRHQERQVASGDTGLEKRMSKVRRRSSSDYRGSAAVEFAIILPILLLIIFSVIEFSLALYDKAVITNAAREAARAGVVVRKTRLTAAEIETVANNYLGSRLISFGAATPTITVSGAGVSGANLSVTVDYTFTGLGVGPVLSAITGPVVLSSRATMINE